MVPHMVNDNDETARLYEESFQRLATLPVLARIPPGQAAELIDDVLVASLFRRRANLEQWLTGALTLAVKQMEESQ
ncbi:MAG TPA: hypothetical protein VGF48_05680 [Thermoanaerobaculia bacterium]